MDVSRADRLDPFRADGSGDVVHRVARRVDGVPPSGGSCILKIKRELITVSGLLCSALMLSGCNEAAPDPKTQVGEKPDLPALQQYLIPPMHVASVVGWKSGQKPSVPDNLKIDAIAIGLQHPRSLYTLPNGDILVVESKAPGTEPVKRPKDF